MTLGYSIVTVAGRNKHALKTASNEPMVFTEIALGSGDRSPSGGETALENEVFRSRITGYGTETSQPNTVWFDLYVPNTVDTFYAQEIGLFDEDGVLYAISKFDQPVPKFGPDSSSLTDLTFRMSVTFSDTENLIVNASPVAGITTDTLVQHLPWATDEQASNENLDNFIISPRQMHSHLNRDTHLQAALVKSLAETKTKQLDQEIRLRANEGKWNGGMY